MKIHFFVLQLLLVSLSSYAGTTYYGTKSTEAILEFEAQIEISTKRAVTLQQLAGSGERAGEIRELVNYQLSFLIGHFQSHSHLKRFPYPGVLGDSQTIKFKKVGPRVGETQLITYSFKGKTNFHEDIFGSNLEASVPLRIPLNTETFYRLGLVKGVNKCTDEHYNSEDDLFYFWDPELKGCPLKGDTKTVQHIDGKLKKLNNTKSSYPEYDRLYLNQELKVSIFFGYIDDYPAKIGKKDDAYLAFEDVEAELLAHGFEVMEEKTFGKINHLRVFEKSLINQLGQKQKVVVEMLLSDTSLNSTDSVFVSAFTKALMESQIVAYDGHSGLGGNLDISRFPISKLKSQYQVYFFNGCSSYPYFNGMYFSKKPQGKKNLEIITSGLPTLSSTSATNMLAFIDPFIQGKTISYQTLLNRIENSNGNEDTYLMGVNGDEDNSFKP